MELVMIQDKIIEASQLEPAYMDRGLFFGDGVYEVVRSYDGGIFALDEHLSRFKRSLKAIKIEGVDIEDIRQRIIRAFKHSEIADCAIYFHITRGSAPRAHNWPADIKWNFFLMVSPITDYDRLKTEGVRACYYEDQRWQYCDVKSLNLLPNVLAKHYAQSRGCFEAILIDRRGDITEGASSTFAAIFGNKILTRPLGHNILPSITRKYVAAAAEMTGMDMVEKILSPFDVKKADEVFLGVTTKDIVGVVELEGREISAGKIGEKTKRLQAAFKELVKNNITSGD